MPYSSNDELPQSVRDVLPDAALSVFRRVYNSQSLRKLSEERSFLSAWVAVKSAGYEKDEKTGKWVKVEKGGDHDQKEHGNWADGESSGRGSFKITQAGSAYGSVDVTGITESPGRGGDVRIVSGGKVRGAAEFDLKSSSYNAVVYEDRKVKSLGVRSRDKDRVTDAVVEYLTGETEFQTKKSAASFTAKVEKGGDHDQKEHGNWAGVSGGGGGKGGKGSGSGSRGIGDLKSYIRQLEDDLESATDNEERLAIEDALAGAKQDLTNSKSTKKSAASFTAKVEKGGDHDQKEHGNWAEGSSSGGGGSAASRFEDKAVVALEATLVGDGEANLTRYSDSDLLTNDAGFVLQYVADKEDRSDRSANDVAEDLRYALERDTTVGRVSTYEEAGVLSGNVGLVVRGKDNSEHQFTIKEVPRSPGEFQVSIVTSKLGLSAKKSAASFTAEIQKLDEDQNLVFGFASIIEDEDGNLIVDSQGDVITPDELQKAAHRFIDNYRNVGEMHQSKRGIGRVVESLVLTRDVQKVLGCTFGKVGWFIVMKIDNPEVWAKVKSGEYKAFSIGGRGVRDDGYAA